MPPNEAGRSSRRHIVDREYGEWFWKVSREGVPDAKQDKVGPWKCPYHNSRACFEVMERLDVLKAAGRLRGAGQDKALSFEPLTPNKKTITAMNEARSENLESVSLIDLQTVLNAGICVNRDREKSK